jgi:hypothetical protein
MTDDLMHHAPHCERPGVTTTRGHSVDVVKGDGCGCLSTTRHMPPTTTTRVNKRTDKR